jgi:biopolymer transport protein ExbD
MNFRKKLRVREEAGFDLTAMIDITLLLLTFFVMGSQFQQSMRAEMELPNQAGEAPRAESTRAMLVDLLKDGTLRAVNGRPLTVAEFTDDVRREVQASGGPGKSDVQLTVRADRNAPALHLNNLALELARAGLRTWHLATQGSKVEGMQ